MRCDKCLSLRVAEMDAKCGDCCGIHIRSVDYDGYVPKDLGIGGGDYVSFAWCLDCGKVQGRFPLSPSEIESVVV